MADPYYYNSRTGISGQFIEITMWPALKAGVGWHGPFDTKEEMLKYYNDNKAKNPGWKAPTDSLLDGIGNLAGGAGSAASGALGLGDVDIQSWLLRIGEILLGIVLIGVGIAKLTGTTNVISKAAKAAL